MTYLVKNYSIHHEQYTNNRPTVGPLLCEGKIKEHYSLFESFDSTFFKISQLLET